MATLSSITVGLLWHSVNSDNFGIGALTVSHIGILDDIGRELGIALRYRVICWRDQREAYVNHPDLDVVPLRARQLIAPTAGLFSAVRSCDVVLDISAGDSFADIYGARRFLLNALAKIVVLLARRPLVLSPQTIGPFQRRWARMISKMIMNRAHMVVSRDTLTTQFLDEIGFKKSVIDSVDVAFRLPYEKAETRESAPVRVGLNVSGLLFNGGYTQDNMFALAADYAELVRSIVSYFTGKPDCEVHLISHVISDRFAVEDDYRASLILAEEFPGVVVAPRFENPSAAKSYIATMDLFCGSRMHACIAAFSSGVPVVPIAYSRKFAGVFGSIGYTLIADCKTEPCEQILDKVIWAYERRSELKDQIVQNMKIAEEKLRAYEKTVHELLTAAAAKKDG